MTIRDEPARASSSGTLRGFATIYASPLYLLGVSFDPSLQPGLPSPSEATLKWYAAAAC